MKDETAREHYLFVCMGTRCRETSQLDDEGASVLQQNLKAYVKACGWKESIRVGKSGCLGSCDSAPNIMFQPENRLCSNVHLNDENDIKEILRTKME